MKDGGKTPTLADWIAGQPAPPSDPVLERFEGRLTELSLLSDGDAVGSFESRLEAAVAPSAEARRSLLLDSLDLDLSAALVAARKRQNVTQDLRLTLAELTLLHASAAQAIADRAERPDPDAVRLLAEAEAALARTRDALAAKARRAAVLQSLAGLGYEVREGLATAWVDEARVVLRKAAQSDYGIEISGDPAGARMQMRVVAFGDEAGTADPKRDQDAETQWCGDVAVLQSSLAAAGGGLVIERALAVGATPVKRVAAPAEALSRAARGRARTANSAPHIGRTRRLNSEQLSATMGGPTLEGQGKRWSPIGRWGAAWGERCAQWIARRGALSACASPPRRRGNGKPFWRLPPTPRSSTIARSLP